MFKDCKGRRSPKPACGRRQACACILSGWLEPFRAVWTNTRFKEAGYDVDGVCMWGAETDTISHMLFRCSVSEGIRQAGDPGLIN